MRIVRGMQKSTADDQRLIVWENKSVGQGIGVAAPKARKRDKLKPTVLFL